MFLIRPTIHQGESLSGYLYRLSIENQYPNITYVSQLLNISEARINNNDFDEYDIMIISKMTNIPQSELLSMTGIMLKLNIGLESMKELLMKRRAKYCLECIQSESIHKLEWTFRPLNICIKHNSRLIEYCPKCNKIITNKELIIDRCSNCNYWYSNASKRSVEGSSIFYQSQKELYDALFGSQVSSKFPLCVSVESYISLARHSFYLLEGLNGFYCNDKRVIQYFHNKQNVKQSSGNISFAWANFYWMYLEFPINFFRVLDDFHTYRKNQAKYFALKRFEGIFRNKEFNYLRDTYNNFWLKKIDEGSIRKDFSVFKNNPSLLEKRVFIRKDEIRNTIGLCYNQIEKLSDEKKLKLLTQKHGSVKGYFVDKGSLNDAINERKKLISKKEAALMLGIRSGSVDRLISSGLLNIHKITSRSIAKLNSEEVLAILTNSRGVYVEKVVDGYIIFHDALNKFSVCRLTIESIIKFTKGGILNPVFTNPKGSLADNYYRIDELKSCIEKIKFDLQINQGIYKNDVIRILRIGEKKMRTLMENGTLTPKKVIFLRDGRKQYIFSKDEIESYIEMNDRYINKSSGWKDRRIEVVLPQRLRE